MAEPIDYEHTVTTLQLDIESLRALDRGGAIEQGHICLAQAKAAFADAESIARTVAAGAIGRGFALERATFHASRAQAFYALAAILPA